MFLRIITIVVGIVIRTHCGPRNHVFPYILQTVFGPDYYVPPYWSKLDANDKNVCQDFVLFLLLNLMPTRISKSRATFSHHTQAGAAAVPVSSGVPISSPSARNVDAGGNLVIVAHPPDSRNLQSQHASYLHSKCLYI